MAACCYVPDRPCRPLFYHLPHSFALGDAAPFALRPLPVTSAALAGVIVSSISSTQMLRSADTGWSLLQCATWLVATCTANIELSQRRLWRFFRRGHVFLSTLLLAKSEGGLANCAPLDHV